MEHRGRIWNAAQQFGPPSSGDPLGWQAFTRQHTQQALIKGSWAAPVDWSDTPDGSDWFFLTGYGRSGSSVLSALISEHPHVWCGCEDHTIHALIGLLTTEWVRTLGSDTISLDWNRREPWTGAEIRAVLDGYRQAMCHQQRTHLVAIGDKSPLYHMRQNSIRQVFPGCKFVFTVRHPLDQLSSMLGLAPGQTTVRWDGDLAGGRRCYAFMEQAIRDLLKAQATSDTIVVQFEDLFGLQNIRAVYDRCITHIGASLADCGTGTADPAALASYDREPTAVGRWIRDEQVQSLLGLWREQGIATPEKLQALMSEPREYVAAVGEAWRHE